MRRGGAPRIFFLAAAALRRSKKTSKNGCGLIGRVGVNQAFCLDVTRPFERKRVLSKRVRVFTRQLDGSLIPRRVYELVL